VTAKRPKDMTDEELASVPEKSQLVNVRRADGTQGRCLLSAHGLSGDDLLGYWQDAEGRWWREPWPG
jgi:hypothetical protein